jgi:uncharacterized protein (DUF58 family)
LWKALRPPRTLKVTRSGRVYLALTLGIGLAALNTGNNLLFLVLGLLLSAIVVSGILSERCLRHLRVERLSAAAAFAGEPFAVRWSVSAGRADGFALTVSEAGAELRGEGHCAYLPAGAARVVRASAAPERRCAIALTGVRITTQFPFGLFAKSRVFALPGTQLVFPKRSARTLEASAAFDQSGGDRSGAEHLEGCGEVIDLRQLGPGEDARRVHWTKSAGAGKLLRTLRSQEHRGRYMLRLPPDLRNEALEEGCERAAAAAHRLLARGDEVGLELGGLSVRPGHGARQEWRILSALACAGSQNAADIGR